MITESIATLYTCSCGTNYLKKEYAEACGTCSGCLKPAGEGQRHHYSYGKPFPILYAETCKDCLQKIREEDKEKQRLKDIKRLEDAALISWSDYTEDMVYDEKSGEFFDEDDRDLLQTYGEEPPEFVYATTTRTLTLDAGDIVESALESDFDEDAWDRVSANGLEKMQVFLDNWCKEENITSYFADFSRKLKVRE